MTEQPPPSRDWDWMDDLACGVALTVAGAVAAGLILVALWAWCWASGLVGRGC